MAHSDPNLPKINVDKILELDLSNSSDQLEEIELIESEDTRKALF